MSHSHTGNAHNAKLNGERAQHVNSFEKHKTNKKRRAQSREIIHEELSAIETDTFEQEQTDADFFAHNAWLTAFESGAVFTNNANGGN